MKSKIPEDLRIRVNFLQIVQNIIYNLQTTLQTTIKVYEMVGYCINNTSQYVMHYWHYLTGISPLDCIKVSIEKNVLILFFSEDYHSKSINNYGKNIENTQKCKSYMFIFEVL